MEIIIGENAGFCFGVKRAVDTAYDIIEKSEEKTYSIGPLIHNELVTSDLRNKGLIEINSYEDIITLKNKKVIIRTHGIEKEIYDILKSNNNEIIDLTCPFVSKIHSLVKEHSEKGYKIIVIGDKDHPEVKGIVSYAKSDIFVIINEDDIKELKINKDDKVFVIFQTTTNSKNAQKLVDILRELFYNIKLVNTICNATQNRQDEVKVLADTCDVMLVIGSSNSSNTKKLYEIAKTYCKDTYFLASAEDAKALKIDKNCKVGVSAGASTPKYLIALRYLCNSSLISWNFKTI